MANLRSTAAIIDALGGIPAVSELTGTSVNGVYNWRSGPQFPADTYLLIKSELKKSGNDAPDFLWPMRQAPKFLRPVRQAPKKAARR